MKKNNKQVCIRIPAQLKKELQSIVERHYITVSQYVRNVVVTAIKKEKQ